MHLNSQIWAIMQIYRDPNCMKQQFDYFISFTTFVVMGLRWLSCFLIYYAVCLKRFRANQLGSLDPPKSAFRAMAAAIKLANSNACNFNKNKDRAVFFCLLCLFLKHLFGNHIITNVHLEKKKWLPLPSDTLI